MRWELSPNQVDLYTADQAAEDPSTYLVNCVYRITGPADEPLLAERFARLGETYPVLASRVVEDDGAWFLEAAPDPPQLRSVQVADAPDGAAARLRLREELTRPLDLAKGPMCRAVLLRYAPETADLVLIAHHLVVDGRSMELIARGVLTDEPTEPAADWADWAAAARARLPRRAGRAAEIRAELATADVAPSLDWAGAAGDAPGAGATTGGGVAEALLPAALHRSLRDLGTELGVTPYSAVLAAVALVLGRNSGAARPVIGTTVSRRSPAHATTVGYFNNTTPVPVLLDGQATVADFLREVHRRGVQAYRDADLPLSSVLPGAGLTAPQLVVSAIDTLPALREGDRHAVPHEDQGLGTAHFPLTLGLYQEHGRTDGIRMLLRHQRALVTEEAAALFFRQLTAVLAHFTDRPDRRLDDVDTLPAEELTALLATGRGARLTDPPAALTELFADRVREVAGRTAVVCRDERASYGELDAHSRQLALALIESGVRPGDRVGVCLDRGVGQIAAVLAVLRAGAAYVPLDPDYPRSASPSSSRTPGCGPSSPRAGCSRTCPACAGSHRTPHPRTPGCRCPSWTPRPPRTSSTPPARPAARRGSGSATAMWPPCSPRPARSTRRAPATSGRTSTRSPSTSPSGRSGGACSPAAGWSSSPTTSPATRRRSTSCCAPRA